MFDLFLLITGYIKKIMLFFLLLHNLGIAYLYKDLLKNFNSSCRIVFDLFYFACSCFMLSRTLATMRSSIMFISALEARRNRTCSKSRDLIKLALGS
jgi:hypothetical protein